MAKDLERELTTLEYLVLGLISMEPQSGYSIISTFESGRYRWSGSPGSVYPILKRLEKQRILVSELEVVHETRPRKIYSLAPLGEEILDDWLRSPLTRNEVMVERDLVLMKFLFAERRLSRQEVLAWLDAYAEETENYHSFFSISPPLYGDDDPDIVQHRTPHTKLINEAVHMELSMQREWIKLAKEQLMDTGQ
jgi:DNA-binding PadR family transcriptional regulator